MLSSTHLIDSCLRDSFPIKMSTIADYFPTESEDDFASLFSLYQIMIRNVGVTALDLHSALLSGSIPQLIHNSIKKLKTENQQIQKIPDYDRFLQMNLEFLQLN